MTAPALDYVVGPWPGPRPVLEPSGPQVIPFPAVETNQTPRACPAKVWAVLGLEEPVRLPCGLLDGHDGNHVYHIEWS